MKKWGLLCLFLLIPLLSGAELKWKETDQTLSVGPTQLKAIIYFHFQNTGSEPVEFLSLRPSCGCLSIFPEKKVYDPGESGTLKVIFNLEGRLGPQKKSIKVITSDQPNKPQTLSIHLNIPESYHLSPQRLLWSPSEAGQTKIVTLTNSAAQPIQIKEARSTHPDIAVKVETVRDGFAYRIAITPQKNLSHVRALIRISTIPPKGENESRGYKIYLRVE